MHLALHALPNCTWMTLASCVLLRKQEKNILMSTMNACRQKLLPVRGLAPTKAGMKDVNDDIMEIFETIEDIPNMPRKFFQSLFGGGEDGR